MAEGMKGTARKTGHDGVSSILVFLVATLGATLLQYLATVILAPGAPLHVALPVIAGALVTLFVRLLARRQCLRCATPADHDRLQEAYEGQLMEIARLRRQNAEADRQILTMQRQAAKGHSDFSLKRHETRFQVAFHATPDPILFSNADTGLIMDVNESFLHLLGLGWQEVMGMPLSSIIRWNSAEDEERFRILRQSGAVSNLRATIRTGGAPHRQFLISARAIELEGVRSDIVIARDISDLEALRQELASKTELLESVLRHIPYYIFWKDTAHRYVGANDQFREAFFGDSALPLEGSTDGEAGGKTLLLGETFEHGHAEDIQVLANGQPIINDERVLHLCDGKRVDVLVSKVPLRDKQGAIAGLLGIIADISDKRQHERQFLMLLNGIPDPAWLKDAEGRYLVANRAFADMVNRPASEIAGLTDEVILPESMARRCAANDRAVLKTGLPLRNDEHCDLGDATMWYEVIRQPLTQETPDQKTNIVGTMGIARDISARRKAEDEIRKLSRALEQSSAAVAITSREGIIEYVNPRYTEVTGYLPAELYTASPAILSDIDDITPDEIWKRIQCGEQWQGEFRTHRKGGDTVWLLASISPVMDDAGNILHALIVLDDITRRKEQDEYIRFMAMHDGLTTLPNRRLFMDQLRHAVAVFNRTQTPFALLFLDLNNFKEVNDTLGHDAGDIVLRTIAERIVASLREVDMAARLGGDEFVVLLHGIRHPEEVQQAGTRIAESIAAPIRIGNEERCVGAAIGVAMCPQHSTDPDMLLSMADKAMYQSKSDNYCLYVADHTQD